VTGTVEMRYDPEQRRVIYQPVTIDPREIIPRVIREEDYGAPRDRVADIKNYTLNFGRSIRRRTGCSGSCSSSTAR
jgi:hypothetical protein